jgi:hypothetical protein
VSQLTEQPDHFRWIIPLTPAALIAIYAIVLGYSRDFGVGLFFVIILLAALPLLIFLGAMLFVALRNPERRWDHWAALCIVLASPGLGYSVAQVRDQAHFLLWAPFHRSELHIAADRDGIITKWDVWGLAGMFNASYLVRDGHDQLTSLSQANTWRQRLGLPCEIVATHRVWRQLYVVTTSECEF